MCPKRSELFGCIATFLNETSGCVFPTEAEIARKTYKIIENTVDLICLHDENDYAIYDARGEAEQCVHTSKDGISTCTNKAIYSVAKRILEKYIENGNFRFVTEAEDCK